MSQFPIIFLDIDGVMRPKGVYDAKVDNQCAGHLKALCRVVDARIVISSTWRWVWTMEEFNAIFEGRVIGITPDVLPADSTGHDRMDEIRAWMRRNGEPDQWIALDDDHLGFPPGANRVHFTNSACGLTRQDALAIISALRRPVSARAS